MQKFLIFLIVIERNDRYAILELIKVGVCCVIDEKDVLQVAVLEHSKILDVDALLGLPAMASVKSVGNEFLLWVEMIEHDICVTLMTGCEYDDLAELCQFLQKSDSMWPDVYSGINFLASGELDFETDIIRGIYTFIAVNKGLIQIQHYGILV